MEITHPIDNVKKKILFCKIYLKIQLMKTFKDYGNIEGYVHWVLVTDSKNYIFIKETFIIPVIKPIILMM